MAPWMDDSNDSAWTSIRILTLPAFWPEASMKNDNDSNADLDLNLNDEFELEDSSPELSFDGQPTSEDSDSRAKDDDSVELDDLFGDSNDEFDFSKKEEIDLDNSVTPQLDDIDEFDQLENDEPAEIENTIVVDPEELVEAADEIAPLPAPPEIAEPALALAETDSDADSEYLEPMPAASKPKGFFAKILGLFSRQPVDDNYGADYSEYEEDELAAESANVEGSDAPDDLELDEHLDDDVDVKASVAELAPEIENDDALDLEFDDETPITNPSLDHSETVVSDDPDYLDDEADEIVRDSQSSEQLDAHDFPSAAHENEAPIEASQNVPEFVPELERETEHQTADVFSEATLNIAAEEEDSWDAIDDDSEFEPAGLSQRKDDFESPDVNELTIAVRDNDSLNTDFEDSIAQESTDDALELEASAADQNIPEVVESVAETAATGGIFARIMGLFSRTPSVDPEEELQVAAEIEIDSVSETTESADLDSEPVEPMGQSNLDHESESNHLAISHPAEGFGNITVQVDTDVTASADDLDDEFDFDSSDDQPHETNPSAERDGEHELDLESDVDLGDEFDLEDDDAAVGENALEPLQPKEADVPTTLVSAEFAEATDINSIQTDDDRTSRAAEQEPADAEPVGTVAELASTSAQDLDVEQTDQPAAEEDSASRELDNLRHQNQKLASDLETLQSQSVANQEELLTAKSSLDSVMAERSELALEIEQLRTALESSSSELEQTRLELQNAQVVADASADVSAKADAAVNLAAAEPGSSNLQQQLETEKQLRADAEQYLVEAEEQRNDVARLLRKTRTELKELQESTANLTESHSDPEQIESLSRSLEQMTSERDASKAEAARLSKSYAELEEDMASTEDRIKEMTTNCESLENRCESAEAEVEKLKSELAASPIEDLENRLETAHSQIEKLENENSELTSKFNANSEELKSRASSIESLQIQLDGVREKMGIAESIASEVGEWKGKHDEVVAERNSLKSSLEDAVAESEVRKNNLDSLQSELSITKEKIAAAESAATEANELRADLARVETELVQANNKLDESHSRLELREAEIQKLQSEVSAAAASSEKAEQLSLELSNAKQEIERLGSENSKSEETKRNLDRQLTESKSVAQESKERVAKLEEQVTSLEDHNQTLANVKQEKDELATRLEQMKTDGEMARTEFEELLKQLRSEKSEMEARLAAEQQLVAERDQRVQQLSVQHEELQKQVESAQSNSNRQQELEEALRKKDQQIDDLNAANQTAQQRIEELLEEKENAAKRSRSESEKSDVSAQTSQETDQDKLSKISGIGPVMERKLIENGITTFAQIASWSDSEVKEWESRLSRSSISKDGWVEQAKKLMN